MQSPGHGEAPIRPLLERYVKELKAAGAIRSPSVEAAFLAVERHRLVETFYRWTAQWQDASPIPYDPEDPDPEQLELIYSNTALGTRFVDGMPASSTSQPALVAEMLELLELEGGMKVLEIGAGTGYNAALMAEIVGDQRLVVTVDILEDVVTQTRRLLAGNGLSGDPGASPRRRRGRARGVSVRPDRRHRGVQRSLAPVGGATRRCRIHARSPRACRRSSPGPTGEG